MTGQSRRCNSTQAVAVAPSLGAPVMRNLLANQWPPQLATTDLSERVAALCNRWRRNRSQARQGSFLECLPATRATPADVHVHVSLHRLIHHKLALLAVLAKVWGGERASKQASRCKRRAHSFVSLVWPSSCWERESQPGELDISPSSRMSPALTKATCCVRTLPVGWRQNLHLSDQIRCDTALINFSRSCSAFAQR